MDALVDFNSGDLVFSRRHVGCRGAWGIKVLPLHIELLLQSDEPYSELDRCWRPVK